MCIRVENTKIRYDGLILEEIEIKYGDANRDVLVKVKLRSAFHSHFGLWLHDNRRVTEEEIRRTEEKRFEEQKKRDSKNRRKEIRRTEEKRFTCSYVTE
jgi:hypothetical protein